MRHADCATCQISLMCLAGRIPDNATIVWQCSWCGLAHWKIITRKKGKSRKEMLFQKYCPYLPVKPKKQSICRGCYMKRELEEDKQHKARLERGEVEPRFEGAWGKP